MLTMLVRVYTPIASADSASFLNFTSLSARDVTIMTLARGRIKIGALAIKSCVAQRAFAEPDRPR